MKSLCRILVAAAVLIMIPGLATGLHAAGMKVGATAWYAWWDSQYIERHMTYSTDFRYIRSSYKMNAAPLYGPMLAFDFGKWSINVIFACGSHYRARSQAYMISSATSYNKTRINLDLFKYDLDPTLTYAVNPYFKIFAGMKIQGYSKQGKNRALGNTAYEWFDRAKYSATSFGPGLGFGITAPLAENLYLITTLSGLYLRTRYLYNAVWYSAFITAYPPWNYPLAVYRTRINSDLNVYGCNAGMSLAYVFAGPSITLSLGGRYQFLKYYIMGQSVKSRALVYTVESGNLIHNLATTGIYSNGFHRIMHNSLEHFYGLTFSVIYSIDFSSAKKEEG